MIGYHRGARAERIVEREPSESVPHTNGAPEVFAVDGAAAWGFILLRVTDDLDVSSSTPSQNEDAKERLNRAGLRCSRVVRVYSDAVLYLDAESHARTAWTVVRPSAMGRTITYVSEGGFIAERGRGLGA